MIADDEHDTARSGGLDPRYDPAFQRGYQPQPGERTRTRVRASAPAASQPAPSRDRSRPAAMPVEAEPVWEADAAPYATPDLSAPSFPVAPGRAVAAAVDDAPLVRAGSVATPATTAGFLGAAELSPRRNPFMLALWIVGAALVVVGVAVYAIAANASYTTSYSGAPSDVSTQVFIQIGWVLAGPMITVGFGTLVALLFLTALAGRRRVAVEAAESPATAPEDDEEL